PGSTTMRSRAIPARSALSAAVASSAATSGATWAYFARSSIVAGVPRMCMRISPTSARATTAASAGSNCNPETAFTMAAPASRAPLHDTRTRRRRDVEDPDHPRLGERQAGPATSPAAWRFYARGEHFAQLRSEACQLDGSPVVPSKRGDAARGSRHERPAPSPQPRAPSKYIGAGLGAPMHQRLPLGFTDGFDEDDERLDADGGEPGRLGFPSTGRERRAHRFGCVRGERGDIHCGAGGWGLGARDGWGTTTP